MRHAPVDDADHLAATLALRGQADLSTGLIRHFEHRDVVATFAGHPCRLQARRAGADHHHLALDRRLGDFVGHGGFAASGGVVDAIRRAALIDAVQAIVGADAGTDFLFALFDDLAHDVRVGHVRPGHADHVHLAGGDGVSRRGDVRDLGRMERRETGG
ncbi:hypothetical protein D3C78_1391650 [compost metagenome]